MAHFPFTKDEIKEWISTTLGEEESISIEMITTVIDQNEIDGKLLLLLYKYPHEIQYLLPNLRARLLLMNSLDVLVKTVGKDLPAGMMSCEVATQPLLWRIANSSKSSEINCGLSGNDELGYPTPQPSSVDDRRSDVPDDNVSEPVASPYIHSGEKSVDMTTCTISTEPQELERSEIPSPVPLPVFDHILQQAIASGRLRERSMRSRLANACARFYVGLKMYPTQLDYHKICERLVEKYPELMDTQPRIRTQPWGQLKKLLSMAFCNVRRIMKMKDLTNARHIITSIQKRYRGFSKDGQRLVVPTKRHSFSEDSDSSQSNDGSTSSASRKRDVLSSPPPVPNFDPDLQKAIEAGKLKDRPWSSQFFRRCARFYTKLKPYPTRRDYKNISDHLALIFPELGHPGHVKHMLSQYIRSYRQSAKLWKLDRQQKARMLTLELSGKKPLPQTREQTTTTTENQLQENAHSALYNFHGGENSVIRDGNQSTQSSYFGNYGDFVSGQCISPHSVDVKPSHLQLQSSSDSNSLSYPVPLPPMDEAMWKGIREGQLQEKNLRNRFIRLCAGFYVSLKTYPTKEDYNNICKTVITEFPDLRDPSPLQGCPPFMLFKKALTACIRNKRRDSVSPANPADFTSLHSDPNSSQRNACTVKLERPMEWPYYSLPTTATQGISEYRDTGSRLSESLPAVSFSTNAELIERGTSAPQLTPSCPHQTFTQIRDSEMVNDVCTQGTIGIHSGVNPGVSSSQVTSAGSVGQCSYSVPMPIFSPNLKMLLDTGQPILGDNRTTFLQNCVDFYLQLKLFPNRADFSAICAQLVQAFPQLADPGSIPGRMGYANMKKELSMQFNNYQQRLKASSEKIKDEKQTSHRSLGLSSLTCADALPASSSPYNSNVSVSSLVHL